MNSKSQIKIKTNGILSTEHIKSLSLLYRPIIENDAFITYLFFNSIANNKTGITKIIDLIFVLQNLNLNINNFLKAKEKLEAVGLIDTFFNEKENYYVIRLNMPRHALGFKSCDLFIANLNNKIGAKNLTEIFNEFKLDQIIFDENFKNVSKSFDEVFKALEPINFNFNHELRTTEQNKNIMLKKDFNIFDFLSLIPEEIIRLTEIDRDDFYLSQIKNIAFFYNLSEENMKDIFIDSFHKNNNIIPDQVLLKNNANLFFNKINQNNIDVENLGQKEFLDKIINYPPHQVLQVLVNESKTVIFETEILECENFLSKNEKTDRAILICVLIYVAKLKMRGKIANLNSDYLQKTLSSWIREGVNSREKAYLKIINGKPNSNEDKKANYKNKINKLKKELGQEWLDDIDKELDDLKPINLSDLNQKIDENKVLKLIKNDKLNFDLLLAKSDFDKNKLNKIIESLLNQKKIKKDQNSNIFLYLKG